MSGAEANPERGEASLTVGGVTITFRPSFAALVKAEQELGPLLALVERAAQGQLGLSEIVGLLWHTASGEPPTRETLGEAIVEIGIAAVTPVLRALIAQILKGR